MYAERLILETDVAGRIKEMPILPANKQMEAIFLVTDDLNLKKTQRQPHPDIAGKAKVIGDIIDTVSQAEWNLPK